MPKLFEERRDWFVRRAVAMHRAHISNEKKMEKVKGVDSFWRKFRAKAEVAELTDEQRKEVEAFWSRYSFAYQNNILTQQYYTKVSGRFDPRYCSEGLNAYYMYRFYDSVDYHTAFHDKNYRECLFHDFRFTPAVAHRIRGCYYNDKMEKVRFYQMVNQLEKLVNTTEEKLIVKPTPGGGGNGIQFIRRGDTKTDIANLLDSIKGDDVIIERFIKAHPVYAAANPTSLNTLRIITFMHRQEFQVICIVFRMGATGKEVDNFAQGGVACPVSPEGICADWGVDHWGKRHDVHPNGFEFAGYKLCSVDKALEMVKKMHARIPQFKQMSWDIAIDETGEPMLVEMNPRGDIAVYQVWGALPFGEKTKEILDEYLLLLYYDLGADWTWDYKEYHDHIALIKYDGLKKDVIVPEQIKGKPVTTLEKGCFSKDKVRKITLPGCVKSLGDISKEIEVVQLEDTRGIVVEAPTEVNVASSDFKVTVSWENSDTEAYTYVYRMQLGSPRKFMRVVMPGVTSFVDHDALPGVAYQYSVRSYRTNCAMYSDWVKAKTIVPRK